MFSLSSHILRLFPFLLFFLLLPPLWVDYELQIPELKEDSEEVVQTKLEKRVGLLGRIQILQEFLVELEGQTIPQEAEPEESLERIRRILIGQRLILFTLLFLAFLALSAGIAHIAKAWFAGILLRLVFLLNFPLLLQQALIYTKLGLDGSFWYFGISGIFYVAFLINVLALFWIKKETIGHSKFLLLKHASNLDEEGRIPNSTERLPHLRILFHLVLIVTAGILIGNLIYIPLFSLQKHYSAQFGSLIGGLLIALGTFYVFNYQKNSGQSDMARWQQLLVSFAYLQFRFLRNLFWVGVISLVLLVSVSFLFRLLSWNTELLQRDAGILEESTNL